MGWPPSCCLVTPLRRICLRMPHTSPRLANPSAATGLVFSIVHCCGAYLGFSASGTSSVAGIVTAAISVKAQYTMRESAACKILGMTDAALPGSRRLSSEFCLSGGCRRSPSPVTQLHGVAHKRPLSSISSLLPTCPVRRFDWHKGLANSLV